MNDAVIVLNAGSSSLKFSIYRVAGAELAVEARGQVEGMGTAPHFIAKDRHGKVLVDSALSSGAASKGVSHSEAFAHLADWIRNEFSHELTPFAVGHRVVHGGGEFAGPTLVDAAVMAKMAQLSPLAPLHQPHNLSGIEAVTRLRPDLPQVACFDTAFHRGRTTVAERFALPDELFRSGVRRWGFHGLSYQSIARRLPSIAPEIAAGRVIVAHLGSGASMCAILDGRSVDTTMGFSVLDGLPMGTRCGSLDPGVILYLLGNGMNLEQLEALLYRKSGLLGISGVSNDVRDLLASKEPLAAEAIGYFVYRIVREIGSLAAALGGIDALIFTAGVGENSPVIRQRVCDGLAFLGIAADPQANARGRGCVSRPASKPSVWVIATDEEAVIAADTFSVVRAALTPQPS